MMRTLAGTALCVAVYLSGAIQAPTNMTLIAANEVATVKPGEPMKPHRDDDCVPTGVVKTPTAPSTGKRTATD